MATFYRDIFDYVTSKETDYQKEIEVNDSWRWGMKDHVTTSELYYNSQLKNGKDDFTPVKNIVRSIINLQRHAEDLEVKDIQVYVDDPEKYEHLSFLVKKYHDDVYVWENNVDEFLDDLNNQRIIFGGGLSKYRNLPVPEVSQLESIAFCNQKDLLGSPIGFLHEMSPDKLMAKKGWGDTANGATHTKEQFLRLWRAQEKNEDDIKVYEVHGMLQERFADPLAEEFDYRYRVYIIAFYTPKDSDAKQGVILYTQEEENPFKLIQRDKIFGRALGFGGVEELFEAQVWTNYDVIRLQKMLDSAATTLLTTDDPTLKSRHPNGLKNLKNLSVVERTPGTTIGQIDTFPRNAQLFENSIVAWEQHAKDIGSATDVLQGKEPSAGTPFKSVEAQLQQGMSIHEFRRGQFAKHVEEIYRDWILPHIKKKVVSGKRFLSTLSVDELNMVADRMSENAWANESRERVLNGQDIFEGEKDMFIADFKEQFKKGGNKRFIEILKNEFRDAPLAVKVNVAGKSKNLALMVDKMVNIWRFIFSNPQGFAMVMQMPGMAKNFNEILEFSGLSPMDLSNAGQILQPQEAPAKTPPELELTEKE